MKVNLNRELEIITIIPELKELVLAIGSNDFLDHMNSNEHESISSYKEVIIDIRLTNFLSQVGVRWLYQLVLDLRSQGFNPYLVLLESVRKIMINTGMEKIVDMHTTFNFERIEADRVIDLEKDLLWDLSTIEDKL